MPRFEGDPWVINKSKSDKRQSANILDPKVFGYGETTYRNERQKPEAFTTRGTKDTIIIEDENGFTTIKINPKGSIDKQRPEESWEEREPVSETEGKKKLNTWLNDQHKLREKEIKPEHLEQLPQTFRTVPELRRRKEQVGRVGGQTFDQPYPARESTRRDSRREGVPAASYEQQWFSPQETTRPSPQDIEQRAYNNYQEGIRNWHATYGYGNDSGIIPWKNLPYQEVDRLRRIAADQIQAERKFYNNQQSSFPVRESTIPSRSKEKSFQENDVPSFQRAKDPQRRSSGHDKIYNRPTERSQENELKYSQEPEKIKPSTAEIEDKARELYDRYIKHEKTNNRARYEQQKMSGFSFKPWERLDGRARDNYRDDAYDEIMAERKRDASTQKKSSHERSHPTTRDVYVEKEDVSRPPVTTRNYDTPPKRRHSMSQAETPRQEENFAMPPIKTQEQNTPEYPQPKEAERPSVHGHSRRTTRDTVEKEDRSRPPVTKRTSTRERSSSMSRAYPSSRENTTRSQETREPFSATTDKRQEQFSPVFLQQMEAEREASQQKKSRHEQPLRTRQDAYVEEPEEVRRPPLSSKNRHTKRSHSMSRAETPRREEKFSATPIKTQEQKTREKPRPMKAERPSVHEQFRPTTRDTYAKEDKSRPSVTKNTSTRKRQNSMSAADTTRPKENLDAQPINIQEQNTRVYSHKVNQDSVNRQSMKTEKQSLTESFLKAAEEDWLASGAYGKENKELERINARIRKIEWQDFEPSKRKSEYDKIMNAYAARYNDKPDIAWAVD